MLDTYNIIGQGRTPCFDFGLLCDTNYQRGVHPAWIEVTAEIREGADVGTGVGERESEGSTAKDGEKNGNRSTMNNENERDGTNRSTNRATTGVTDKEAETNISGAGNGSEQSERNRVARGKTGIHGVTKHGGKLYRLRGRGHGKKHGTKHGRKHGKMHGK